MRIRYSILIFSWKIYIFYYLNRLNLAPVVPIIKEDLGISYSEIGLIMSVFMFIYTAACFISGYLADYFGPKKIVIVGCFIVGFANLMFSKSYKLVYLIIAQGINGIGQSFGFPGSYKLTVTQFSKSNRGLPLGFFLTSVPIGMLVSYWSSSVLASHFGWRYSFIIPALILIIAAIIYALVVVDLPKQDEGISLKKMIKRPWDIARLLLPIWPIVLLLVLVFYIWLGFLSWLPSYFVETYSISPKRAGIISTIVPLCGLIARPLAGFFSDKIFHGKRKGPLVIGTIVLCFATLILWVIDVSLEQGVFIIGLIGFSLSYLDCLLFTYPGDIFSQEILSTGAGFLNGISHISGILGIYIIGILLDRFNSFGPAIFSFFITSVLAAFSVLFVKESSSRESQYLSKRGIK